MKALIIFFVTGLALCISADYNSQYQSDFGIYLGASNYLGEIGGKEDIRRDFIFDMKLAQTNISYGAFFRHRLNDSYGISSSLTVAKIEGNDALTENLPRHDRNLSFQNIITELSVRGEYYFYTIHDIGNHGRYLVNFRPYVFAGFGIFHHAPKAFLEGNKYDLRSLKTEGQNEEYSLVSLSIPFGMGCYFTYKNRFRFSFEMSYRKTFTDYLDDISTDYANESDLESEIAIELANRNDELASNDVSIDENNYSPGNKRGDSENKDSFLTSHLGISYVLRGSWKNHVLSRGPMRPKFIRTTRVKF